MYEQANIHAYIPTYASYTCNTNMDIRLHQHAYIRADAAIQTYFPISVGGRPKRTLVEALPVLLVLEDAERLTNEAKAFFVDSPPSLHTCNGQYAAAGRSPRMVECAVIDTGFSCTHAVSTGAAAFSTATIGFGGSGAGNASLESASVKSMQHTSATEDFPTFPAAGAAGANDAADFPLKN